MNFRFALPAVIILVGCSSSAAPDRLEHSAARIISGELDEPPKYEPTVSLVLGDSDCSGTLVSPHVVVTARHCVSDLNDTTNVFGADIAASSVTVFYGTTPKAAPPDNYVTRIVHTDSTDATDNDIALLVLKDAAKTFAPIRLAKTPQRGEMVAVAGYGMTAADGPADSDMHRRYRRENLTILAVGPLASEDVGTKEIMLGESICSGDSGGPVYAQATGALLAVTSRGGNDKSTDPASCIGSNTRNIFTRVDGFASLIASTAAAAGDTLWEEGTPMPGAPTTDAGPSDDADTAPVETPPSAQPNAADGATGSTGSSCSIGSPGAASSGAFAALGCLTALAALRRRKTQAA